MTRKPNGGGTLFKEKGRGWRSQGYVTLPDGRRVRVSGRGATPELANRARQAAETKVETVHPDAKRMTVKRLAERWQESARARQWSPETKRSYKVALDKHILPVIGSQRIGSVRGFEVQAVVDKVMADSEDAHWSVANRCLRVMKTMFAVAVKWGLLTTNPASGVDKVNEPQIEHRRWSKEEALSFLAAAEASIYRDVFYVAIVTGLRSGEIIALRWRDVSPTSITVRRTFSQSTPGKVQTYTKNRQIRTVPMSAELMQRLVAGAEGKRLDDLVFRNSEGGMANPSTIRKEMIRLAKLAKVPTIRFHDLRVTYSSIMAEAGHHPSVIQKLLGHRTPYLAMKVYTTISEEALSKAVLELGSSDGSSPSGPGRPHAVSLPGVLGEDSPPDTTN